MKVDIFNTDKKYQIIYADPPWKYNDKMKMEGTHGMIRGGRVILSYYDIRGHKKTPDTKDSCG